MKSKNTILLAVVAVALVAVLGSYWMFNQNIMPTSVAIGDVTAVQAQDVIQAEAQNPEFVILDVRTPQEYWEGHVDPQGAKLINLDFYEASFKEALGELDKSKTYLIYCRSGNRSSQALTMMEDLGFEHIYHMSNGFNDWQSSDMPIAQGS